MLAPYATDLPPDGFRMSLPALLLPELDQVLENGSAPRRAEALSGVAGLFREKASRLNGEHIRLFGQVFERLLGFVDRTARIELSRLLAPIGNSPAGVMMHLAMDDDIAVAGPALEHSTRFEPPDLANIARQKSQQHLLALSARQDIAEAVTDILVRRGNQEVLCKLVGNGSARVSAEGFAALVETARLDAELAAALARRADFPPQLFRDLLVHASETVREHLRANSAGMHTALRQIVQEFRGETPPPRDYAAAQTTVFALHQKGALDERQVAEFATAGQTEDAVAGVALLCAVPVDVVDRIFRADRLDPVLIICKAAGWSWQTVRALANALPNSARISGETLDLAYANFERLSPMTAQRVMRFWQVQHWQPSGAAR
jgi:uncharacterized protein (DUF2336 family)